MAGWGSCGGRDASGFPGRSARRVILGGISPDRFRTERAPRGRRALIALAAGLAAWLALAGIIRLASAGEVLPGTRVLDVSLGGTDLAQARERLEGLGVESRSVDLVFRDRSFEIGAPEIGFRLEAAQTAERAMDAGRSGVLSFLATPARYLGLPRELDATFALEEGALRADVEAIAERVDRDPNAGAMTIDTDSLTATVKPPRDGRAVRTRAAETAVRRALTEGREEIPLPVDTVRGPTRAAVQEVARAAERYLEQPLTLTAGTRTVELPARRVAPLLAVEPRRGRRVALGVDSDALSKRVEKLAKRLDREVRDARIDAPAAPVTLEEKGDLSWRQRPADVSVTPARTGRTLDRDGAQEAIAAAVRAGDHAAELPVERPEPRLSTEAARRARRLIGTFTTRFPCCEPRVKNILRMAEIVDGTVILPGEQFSLNGVAGQRTRERGFVPAPFIGEDNKIVPSVGGGVSQFSTTTYNAAYFAGLQIDYHQPHSLYIDRYPPGREATLDFDTIDLTWTNDTDAPVLVRTFGTTTSVTVSLYGDNGGRRVSAESGPRQNVQGGNFAITVTRTVRMPGGETRSEPYTTTYDRPNPEDE